MNRRKFIKKSALSGLSLGVGVNVLGKSLSEINENQQVNKENYPLVIATWNVPNASERAWEVIQQGGSALDAVEKGCNVEEEDPNNSSVG